MPYVAFMGTALRKGVIAALLKKKKHKVHLEITGLDAGESVIR